MALLLTIVGWVFVVFGVLAWTGITADKPPVRGAIVFPSAIQETPIFLAIGFGFVLVAAGAILKALQDAVAALDRRGSPKVEMWSGRAEPAALAVPPALAEAVARASAAGWRIAGRAPDDWSAEKDGRTLLFQNAMELAAWLDTLPKPVPIPARRAELSPEIARMIERMESQGWKIEPERNDAWHATRRGHTQIFSSLEEFRAWLAARASA